MKPVLGVSGEAKTSAPTLTPVSVGQCTWTGRRVIGQIVLLQMLVFTSEGCSKSQSYDASTSTVALNSPHSTTTSNTSPHTSHPTSVGHRLPCSMKQLRLAGCLNGGTCFIIELHNSSSTEDVAHCSCTSDWSGDRCEYRYVDPKDWPSNVPQERLKQILIAAGTGIVVLVFVILISVALYKRKQCTRANSSTASGNSTTGTNNDQTMGDALTKSEEQKPNPKWPV